MKRTSRSKLRTKMTTLSDYSEGIAYHLEGIQGVTSLIASLAHANRAVVPPEHLAWTFQYLSDELEDVVDCVKSITSTARPPQKSAAVGATNVTR